MWDLVVCLLVAFLVSFTLLVSLTLNKLTGDGWMDVDGIDSTIQKTSLLFIDTTSLYYYH